MQLEVRGDDASDNRVAQQRITETVHNTDNAEMHEQARRCQLRLQRNMVYWESQNGCCVSNSSLWRPDDGLMERVPRFRVPRFVYPSVGRVALFLVDFNKC